MDLVLSRRRESTVKFFDLINMPNPQSMVDVVIFFFFYIDHSHFSLGNEIVPVAKRNRIIPMRLEYKRHVWWFLLENMYVSVGG